MSFECKKSCGIFNHQARDAGCTCGSEKSVNERHAVGSDGHFREHQEHSTDGDNPKKTKDEDQRRIQTKTWQDTSLSQQFSSNNREEISLNEQGVNVLNGANSKALNESANKEFSSQKVARPFNDEDAHHQTFEPGFSNELNGMKFVQHLRDILKNVEEERGLDQERSSVAVSLSFGKP